MSALLAHLAGAGVTGAGVSEAAGTATAAAAGHRRGAGPRLRRPVLAADRAPRARVRGVLRAAPARRGARGGHAPRAEGPDPVRGPGVGVRRRRAGHARGAARARDPGARHLLRHAGDGAHARRPRGGRRGRRVRALPAHRRGARAAAGGCPGRAELLDEPSRHRLRGAAGLHRAGLVHRVAGGGHGGPRPRPLRDPVPPRGGAHPLRHADPRDLPARHRRLRHGLERRLGGRGAGGPHPRAGGRRPGDLRALRRRRLLGGRAAHLQGGRRPAHVRVRRSRPDAQERGQPGGGRLPRPLQGAADRGRRRGALPRAARRASPTPRPSARSSARSSSACSRSRPPGSTTRATSCRARSTRT